MKKKRSLCNLGIISEEMKMEVGEPDDNQYFPEFELPVERPKFICSICQKSFSDKNCLKKHIKKIHQLEPEPLLQNEEKDKNRIAPFKCRVCETEFAYKRNLKRHLIKYHSQGLEDEEGGNCFCNVEGCKFRSFFINALRTHLTDEHKVQIHVENKLFNSKAEFDAWKEEEEKTNVCLFIKEAGKHTLINGDQRLIYQCHRSGHYSGHGNGKRSFRIKGTCKLGKRCTAGIELTVKKKGDIHEVIYYKTHIWHTADVIHVNLSASERAFLANKLREGASIASILESVKADKSAEGTNFCKRIHLLKRKDLVNIENTFHLNNTERHIKKQHKKGQKIDRDKIKKNLDDYGEVVSWVVESPANTYEYYTVKKLQPEKCVENCGVLCSPCNACLHMFSCTCHDYLLYGTMCQHIHSVSLSLNPIQKSKRISKSASNKSSTAKRKRKEKMNTPSKEANDSEHKESDIINFLTKNLELQREQEVLQERIKLKEKVDVFNNFCMNKIDQLSEAATQQLMKMMDSAINILSLPVTSPAQQPPPATHSTNTASPSLNSLVHLQSNNVSLHNDHMPTDSVQHGGISPPDNQNIPKSITTLNSLPMPLPERKYETSAQYYPNIKRKRKFEEPGFYRSPVVDKRPVFESISVEHNSSHDNYSNIFDCNLSWQTPTISTCGNPVGKWWT